MEDITSANCDQASITSCYSLVAFHVLTSFYNEGHKGKEKVISVAYNLLLDMDLHLQHQFT